MMDSVDGVNTVFQFIGLTAKKYLPRVKDKDDKFGLSWNKRKNSYIIGNSVVGIEHDDLTIGEKYHGSWSLAIINICYSS